MENTQRYIHAHAHAHMYMYSMGTIWKKTPTTRTVRKIRVSKLESAFFSPKGCQEPGQEPGQGNWGPLGPSPAPGDIRPPAGKQARSGPPGATVGPVGRATSTGATPQGSRPAPGARPPERPSPAPAGDTDRRPSSTASALTGRDDRLVPRRARRCGRPAATEWAKRLGPMDTTQPTGHPEATGSRLAPNIGGWNCG
jgi:hypothetical protein